MSGIINIFMNNLMGFDWLIFVMMGVNLAVFFSTRTMVNRIYYHFNLQDYVSNLNDDAKAALKKTTKKEKQQLTAGELLKYRETMNKRYALYSNLTTMFPSPPKGI